MSEHIHVVVTYDIDPNKYNAWLEAVRPMVINTNKEKGCIRFNVHADKKNKYKMVWVEEWNSQKNLTSHLKQEHVKIFNQLQREQGMIKSVPKIYFCGDSLDFQNIKTSQEAQADQEQQAIDNLNAKISNLKNELSSLRNEIMFEKQQRLEAADRYNKQMSRINKIESEKLELERKMLEISVVNITKQSEFGKSQSPINIISCCTSNQTNLMKEAEFESNPLKFNYPSKVNNCTILNNGHTVQVNISEKCTLNINDKTYELKQFHFHTPSEHTIDGKQYEMEMHLVHLNEENEIAVLGFIFTVGQTLKKPKLELTKSRAHLVLAKDGKKKLGNALRDEESDIETDDEWDEKDEPKTKKLKGGKGNDFLAQFWDELPNKKTESDIPLKNALTFDYLFETSSNNFSKNIATNEIDIDMEIFEYNGSLTTPPYTEGVQWLVSKTTHFISIEQLKKLSACWGNHNNARPVQEYFGRTVSLRSKSSLKVV